MSSSPSGPVAVIDLGSNSIKLLVAAREADGRLVSRTMHTIDARISAGLSRAEPRLSDEGMMRGLAAVRTLLEHAAPHRPVRTVIVATSAVRDARNGGEFRALVQRATGHELRILSGDEEASLIGLGLTCDPALTHLRDFHVFDLGGGSLECLAFRDRAVARELSLPLGCVRLTERFVPAPAEPIPEAALAAVHAHTRTTLAQSGFVFLPGAPAVFTGGTMTAARLIRGARDGRALAATPATVTADELRRLLAQLAALPLGPRAALPGMPSGRADVLPVALATVLALAEAGGFTAFEHSLYNLRWGLAASLLAPA